MALLDGQRRSADAVVAEDARLAVLSREHFLSFVRSSPNVALEMLTALANRLRHTDELLRHSATRNVNVEEAARLHPCRSRGGHHRGIWRQLEIHHQPRCSFSTCGC